MAWMGSAFAEGIPDPAGTKDHLGPGDPGLLSESCRTPGALAPHAPRCPAAPEARELPVPALAA